jgi:hypothetical protein
MTIPPPRKQTESRPFSSWRNLGIWNTAWIHEVFSMARLLRSRGQSLEWDSATCSADAKNSVNCTKQPLGTSPLKTVPIDHHVHSHIIHTTCSNRRARWRNEDLW